MSTGATRVRTVRPVPDATTLLAVACLASVAGSHLADLPHKLEEAPYLAVLFCALIGASLLLAACLIAGRFVPLAWRAAVVLCALAIAGYVLSRSVGLPQIEDHVGDWLDPWGVVAVISEAVLIGLGLAAWRAAPA